MKHEARFRMVEKIDPERYKKLQQMAQDQAAQRWAVYEHLAGMTLPRGEASDEPESTSPEPE